MRQRSSFLVTISAAAAGLLAANTASLSQTAVNNSSTVESATGVKRTPPPDAKTQARMENDLYAQLIGAYRGKAVSQDFSSDDNLKKNPSKALTQAKRELNDLLGTEAAYDSDVIDWVIGRVRIIFEANKVTVDEKAIDLARIHAHAVSAENGIVELENNVKPRDTRTINFMADEVKGHFKANGIEGDKTRLDAAVADAFATSALLNLMEMEKRTSGLDANTLQFVVAEVREQLEKGLVTVDNELDDRILAAEKHVRELPGSAPKREGSVPRVDASGHTL